MSNATEPPKQSSRNVGFGTETVVELSRVRNTEPPLIILHGGGGALQAFEPLKKAFKSGLWGIQITPSTPLHSIAAQAHHYFVKIKEKQPKGPYRLSAFSASSIILVALARIFEDHGDKIIQLAFVDHFPTIFLCPEIGVVWRDDGKLEDDVQVARRRFVANSFRSVCEITRRDMGGQDVRRHELADDLIRALDGIEPSSDFAVLFFETMGCYLGAVFDLVIGMSEKRDSESLMEGLAMWIRTLKAPMTVFVCSNGVIGEVPQRCRKDWGDLGAHRCLDDLRVVYLDAGHYDVLWNSLLIRDLQDGFARVEAML
ncbi:Alpha/Beta hydrolase protein [Favolaschia claudopus]|uniref:Alpha/Beta hydrolase protein n=1 Tax=Favolaschia claudopus TaxID=2862362 RepID=A0AAW0CL92_9AGAR